MELHYITFPSHYKLVTTPYQNKLILVCIKFGHCSFEAAVTEWLVLRTGTNSIRVRTPSRWKLLKKYGRIDYFWVINPLKSQ